MLMVHSPAKALDFSAPPQRLRATRPELREQTAELLETLRRFSSDDIKALMDISDKLAELNFGRFQNFDPDCEEGVQAAVAFAGGVYVGLDARSLEADALDWLQDRLRILSGLYGVLRPLDCIQPYRLEMGSPLHTSRGETLYDFWGGRISQALNRAAKDHADPTLVNLASHEYFGAVDARALKLPVVSCTFKDEKQGRLRVLGLYAKVARGRMVRLAAEGRVDRVEGLKDLAPEGYRFRADLSSATEWVFARPQP